MAPTAIEGILAARIQENTVAQIRTDGWITKTHKEKTKGLMSWPRHRGMICAKCDDAIIRIQVAKLATY